MLHTVCTWDARGQGSRPSERCRRGVCAAGDIGAVSIGAYRHEGRASEGDATACNSVRRYGTLAQAAAACSNNDHCIAFSTTSEDKSERGSF